MLRVYIYETYDSNFEVVLARSSEFMSKELVALGIIGLVSFGLVLDFSD